MKQTLNPLAADAEVVTSIRLSRAAHDRLKKNAALEHRTITSQIRVLVDDFNAKRAAADLEKSATEDVAA